MERPNPFMSGEVVQQYIINALHVFGDAYLLKEKNFESEMLVISEMMKLKDEQIVVAKDETKHYKKQRNLFGIGSGLFSILIILIAL